jgi:2-aminoadipate transaminase
MSSREAREVHAAASPGRPSSDILDLSAGHPDTALLPVGLLATSARRVLGADRASVLGYGPERGDEPFREELAAFLERETGGGPDPGRLFVTGGASMALDLLCTLLTAHGDIVVVAEPTYHLALRIFADHGLRVESVPCDQDGIDVDALARLLERVPARMLYVLPSFANPSGVTMPPERRRALLDLTAEHHLWVIADDVYGLLPHHGDTPPRFVGSGDDQVVTLGSFSKILAPALRLGWIEGPPDLLAHIEQSGLLQSGGGLAPLSAALVAGPLEEGSVERHLRDLRGEYRARAEALTAAIRRELPEARFDVPLGGYFVWLRLAGVDATALLAEARRRGVIFQPGAAFAHNLDLRDHLRLSFARHAGDALDEAAVRLARAVASCHPSPTRDAPGAMHDERSR